MIMVDYSKIGKGGIVKEGIFERFPQLTPSSLPKNWGCSNSHNKLMIVMESNYFKDNVDSVFKDPEAWYTGTDTNHLIPQEIKNLVENDKAGYLPFDRLLKSMNQVLTEIQCEHIYDEALFYNYFLRPATGSNSFRRFCKPIDKEVAGVALCGILETNKPDIVIFASKFAYDEFSKYKKSVGYVPNNIVIDFVYHPSDRFHKWNINPNSKQKFEKLLKDYWIK